ncbi:hypothetical protein GUJ93_ZPchr0012g18772 [Zizania palustris]|uniref:HMA domain-containing protein n=1 Tax=Zizania palustris TaxID=103762 RepID=A0A8J5WMB8_ZIZPA|nr:hypothetical protein GUJ93_ZPchr0012g18772 [Zizania palustris]
MCSGIDALSVDMATQKMTVVGTVDPVNVVSKLRKSWAATIDSVGPAKEPEKKEGEAKKEGEVGKKDGEAKKEGEGEKDGDKKPPTPPTMEQQLMAELMNRYRTAYSYNPYMSNPCVVQSVEENPNSCSIC